MNQVVKSARRPTGFRFRFAHLFYRLAWRLGSPWLGGYLARRAARGKEDPLRLSEKRGESSESRTKAKLLWVHGASVGESLSSLPLIEQLLEKFPDLEVLVTTGTVTSATLLADRLPPRAHHQYIPLDHPAYVKRFYDRWRPDLIFWLESEFWPGLLKEAADRDIPTVLVNARLSDQSFERWQRRPGLIGPLLEAFSLALAQDDDVAAKLEALGARNVATVGNLKFATPPLPDQPEKRHALEALLSGRRLIVGAQTAPGEEVILGRITLHLRKKYDDLLTLIAPRHPERAEEISWALQEQGLVVAVRSRGDAVTDKTDIYLADTMGEMGLFYRLDAPVFLGRSLFPGGGGSNAVEPARLGRAVLQGRYTEKSSATNAPLFEGGAFLQIEDELALCNALDEMLQDPEKREALGARAAEVADEASHVLDEVLSKLEPLLPALAAEDGS